ncbi:NUDIX domain-containing protein [Nocardia xishanensis]|uniref:NUDIX hydrolase n=1 Tax=Nocardia xishanensis TaxID=238964 RepID=UPI0033D053A6
MFEGTLRAHYRRRNGELWDAIIMSRLLTGRDGDDLARQHGRTPDVERESHSVTRVNYFNDPAAPAATHRVPGVSAAVLDEDGRLLLIKRKDNHQWALPGGAIELGESISQAAAREVREEANIDIDITGCAGIYTDPNHIITYSDGSGPTTAIQEFGIVLRARHTGGIAQPGEIETEQARWFLPHELDHLPLHPEMRRRIGDALNGSESVTNPRLIAEGPGHLRLLHSYGSATTLMACRGVPACEPSTVAGVGDSTSRRTKNASQIWAPSLATRACCPTRGSANGCACS